MSESTASLEDLRREIADRDRILTAKQQQLLALYKGTKTATGERAIQPHEAEQIRELEGQTAAMADQVNALKLDWMEKKTADEIERRTKEPLGPSIHVGSGGQGTDPVTVGAAKSTVNLPDTLGDAFVDSGAYKSWRHGGQSQNAHTEVGTFGMRHYAYKATLTQATGPFTLIDKQPDVVALGQQMLTVADLMSQGQTSSTTIRYIQEDTFTNAAAMVAEEGLKPEMTWDLSEVDAVVRKVAVTSKVTDEMFQDYLGIRSYINDRLPFAVRQREELQLISGDGTGQNLLGILNVPGILTQAKGSNTNADSIYLAITKVRSQGFWEPDAVVMDPVAWSFIRLLKTTTNDYVYGHPAVAGPETLFGKRVVITVNVPDTTAIVGAWKIGSTLFYRQGIRVEATNSDQDDFVKNRITLRAEQREVPVWWRPKAFCTVTGLDVTP